MKVPLKWLEDFVTIEVPVAELAERLTFAGLEVEDVTEVGGDWDRARILVGEVVGVRRHPDADKLTLVTVNFGGDPLEMVTGAPNITVGMAGVKVPVALVGAKLRDGKGGDGMIKLKPAKIRGVRSEGMVCSERELGLSEEHGGVMILPDDAPVGTPLREYLGDTVVTMDLTPNLSYCLSLAGVAREVHALGAGRLKERPVEFVEEGSSVDDLVTVAIADADRCPRYTAAVVTGVEVGPAPFWMRHRLRLAGIRPINNIVDITNYVMWETGQPLHAFDYDLLRGGEEGESRSIAVRTAREGEKIVTLDGSERTCTADDLLICDGRGPVAVAGVMGGKATEVHGGTTNVLIESAGFDRTSVRRTAARHRLYSEASLRFGRGVPPAGSLSAAREAADLMRRHVGGTVAKGVADACPRPQEEVNLVIEAGQVERILGVEVPAGDMEKIYTDLGFGVEREGDRLQVRIPHYRLDIAITADLVEEAARITGYDRIPSAPMPGGFDPPAPSPRLEAEDRVRDTLVACGLSEVITYSLSNPALAVSLGLADDDESFLELANPMSADRTHLRRHLLPSLLETLQMNLRFTDRVAIFEVARVYHPGDGELPDEPRLMGILMSGPQTAPWWGDGSPVPFEFFHLKGIIETLTGRMGLEKVEFEPVDRAPYQKGRAAAVTVNGTLLGHFGELEPTLKGLYDLPEGRVVLGEFALDPLLSGKDTHVHRRLSRFPSLTQDLALECPEDVSSSRLEEVLRQAAGPLLIDLRLFDLYRGDQVGEGRKSLAYTLVFQAPDRSLTEKEISRVRDRIVRSLKKELAVDLRS